MSGDVQPRKRKDKRKRKDDVSEEGITQQQQQQQQQQHTAASSPPTEDINIHVHKDSGTGGGICAKFVFFVLLGALAVVIGLIITEHRGLTDLDAVGTESRFSELFAGWIDNSVSHDHDEHLVDHSDEQEEEDSLEDEASEEETQADEASEEQEASEADEEDEEEEEEEDESDNTQEEDEEDVSEAEPESVEQSEEPDEDEDEDASRNVSENEEDDEEDESKDDDDENDLRSEEEQQSEEQEQSEEADDKEDSDEKDNADDGSDEKDIEGDDDDDDQEEALTEDDPQQLGFFGNKISSAKPEDTIRETITPDLTRRNTIVAPPSLEEVEPDMENVEEDYSDEEDEDQYSEDDSNHKPSAAKAKYRELQSTYSKSLTPEKEQDKPPVPTDDYEYYEHDDDDEEEAEEGDEDEEEEEEDEEEIEDISDEDVGDDDEDDELLKKLEAKYGKLQTSHRKDDYDEEDEQFRSWKRVGAPDEDEAEGESDSDTDKHFQRRSGAQSVYDYANITNTDDWAIRDDLDQAEREIRDNAAFALTLFSTILEQHPSSPRALYGKARSLDELAEIKKSNELLQQSINAYWKILNLPDVPDALFQAAGERCANRMQFSGRYGQAIAVHNTLIERFPDVAKYKNQLAVAYLTINKIPQARKLLQKVLAKHPNDGYALVHYGFILKTTDNKLRESVYYLKKGLATKDEGVVDGRFYFHLGDALTRLGRHAEAEKVYEEGVKEKVFISKYQRSLYNVARLTGRPWWRKEQTPYQKLYEALETRWKDIRKEGLDVLSKDGYFKDESENLRDVGDWKQFELFARGVKNVENCRKCPITCRIIEEFPDAKGCKRGQTKFSVMHPGTHVWPHCGPTNCRLRIHLGLVVPKGTYIRVAEETRSWKEGKVFIFDDSFEHEVWHNGTEFRLVLIIDVWHPELTLTEKRALSPI